MKIIQDHYNAFQAMAFSDRKNWQWYARPVWWYLIVFVWLHQGLVYKNWENVLEMLSDEIKETHEEYHQQQNLERIHQENPDIAELTKLAGITSKKSK